MTDLLIKELEQMGKHPSVRLNTDRQVWKEAAAMLRRQHEAIKQLREALEDTAQTLVWMQWGDCRKFTRRKLLTVHEAMERINAALADTEQFINKGN